jgi:hypothetical protein
MSEHLIFEPVLHPPTGQPVAHLPGPWTAEGPDEYGDWNIIPPNDRGAVAAVVSNMRAPEIVEGNALLVAAAPDLLAVAQMAAAQFEFYAAQHDAKGTPESAEKAKVNRTKAAECRAAIAKATH